MSTDPTSAALVRTALAAAIALAVLPGCATTNPGDGSGSSAQPTGATATPANTATVVPQSVLLTYTRSGGVAARTITVVVIDGGRTAQIHGSDGAKTLLELSADQQAALAAAVRDARLDDLAGTRLTSGAADMYTYTFVTETGAKVTVDDGTLPTQVEPLVAILDGLASPPMTSAPVQTPTG